MLSTALVAAADSDCRDLICRLLSDAGAWVIPVANGEDALQVLENAPTQAIITDLDMPRLNGRQLCAAIRRHPTLAATPILLLSTASTNVIELAAIDADGVLQKPFQLPQFFDAYTAALAAGAMRQMETAMLGPRSTDQ